MTLFPVCDTQEQGRGRSELRVRKHRGPKMVNEELTSQQARRYANQRSGLDSEVEPGALRRVPAKQC